MREGEIMIASELHGRAGPSSFQEKPQSWKAGALLGAIVFFGSLGLALLVQEMLFGGSRSAIVKSADPEYHVKLLEKAVARNPGYSGAWLQLGHAYSESGQAAPAAAAYENYLAIDPRSPDIWTKLGIQYMQADRPDKALEAFDRATALNPKHEASRLYKGVVLLNAFSDLRGAIRSWMQVLEINPDASAPDGTRVEEYIRYCLTTAEEQAAGPVSKAE
jgi:cytochrome c-type biogenesis protein CcmH/NrfG